jgi:hypothetical protein
MNYRRAVVPGFVAVVAVTAFVFGPLVAGVSLASESPATLSQEGSIQGASASFPAEATIEPADYGAASYYLVVPSATAEFAAVEGTPTLAYTLEIRALGLQRTTTHFLDSSVGSPFEATMSTATLSDQSFERDQYDARLSLAVRNASDQRTLAARNVTVRVVE